MKIHRLLRKARHKDPARIERQLQRILAEGEEEGIIDPYSGQMIRGVLKFRDTVVREVMIPRTEMVAVQRDAPVREIHELLVRHGYTRIPVYSGTIDNIVGILNAKDLLKFWPGEIQEGDIVSNLKKPYYIPETKNVNILLHEFKRDRHHMAIVMDEYGGTSGLVTIEDLIEEIVGEIFDEYDGDEKKMMKYPDGSVLMDGRIGIEEVGEYFETLLPEGKYETLGGFILHLVRKIPVAGEKINYDKLEMTIEAADERCIRKIRMRKREDTVKDTGAGGTKRSDE
jgi:CBS domain containing-hemolysin-like protein